SPVLQIHEPKAIIMSPKPIRLPAAATALLTAALLTGFAAAAHAQGALNVYSARHYLVDTEVNKRFTEETGIAVRVVNAPANQLVERWRPEGKDSPADLLITVDAAQMQRAAADGLLRSMRSQTLDAATPASL